MRVALLSPVFWPEVRRGSERFARDLADGLRARGHEPRILTSHRGRPRRDGDVLRVPRLPDRRLVARGWEEHLTHVPFTALALRAARPRDDVVHALYPTDALAAPRDRPLVLSFMGIPHRRWLVARHPRAEIARRAAARADAVVALSSAAADAFDRHLGVHARVIAPGVDLDAFAPGPGRASDPTILCAADPGLPRKRVGLLLDAFARVRAQRPDARLILDARAPAPRPPGVEARALDDTAALAAANREAWVHALPSVGEAFGLVLAEALACGTPVVGPNPDLVAAPGTGVLFDGDDSAELAQALLAALDLDPATSAPACRARASAFSTDATTDAYLALYDELTAARRG